MSNDTIIVVTTDRVVAGRVQTRAHAAGLQATAVEDVSLLDTMDEPAAVIADLDIERSLEFPARIRARWRRALLAAFVSAPDRSRWEAALSRGYDLVSTRGAIAGQTIRALETWDGPASARRIRLFDAADAAGRLGLVYRTAETPVGPVAVYQLGSQLFAVGDVCPHAGAILSDGELSEGIVTCPLHGSRFDVRTGERVRGPADEPLPCFNVVIADGGVSIELAPER